MLQAHPTYSIQSTASNEYGIMVFIFIDCDEGPLDSVLVASLQQFHSLYQTSRRTLSFCMAEWLVEMGFFLMVRRVKGCGIKTSLLLTSDPEEYTYPEYKTDINPETGDMIGRTQYIPITMDNPERGVDGQANLNVYGVNITIPKDGIKGRTITIDDRNVYYDYILTHVNKNWWMSFLFDRNNSTINQSMSRFRFFYDEFYTPGLTPEGISRDVIVDTLEKVFVQTSGYIVNSVELNADGSKTIKLASMQEKIILDSSFPVEENYFINYDMASRHLQDRKVVEIYSKYDTNLDNIEIEIQKLGSSFNDDGKTLSNHVMYVRKFNEDGEIILSETYSITSGEEPEEYTNLVNLNSSIIEAYFYNIEDLPVGIFRLGRFQSMTDATEGDFTNLLGDYERIESDIIVDSGFTGSYARRLEELCDITNVFLTSYNSKTNYNKLSECIFNNSTFIYNEVSYPSYMLLLYILSTSAVLEGYAELNIAYTSGSEVTNIPLNINDINIDNYGSEIKNPLGYYKYSTLSLDGILKIIMVLNYVRGGIKANPTLDEEGIRTLFTDAKTLAINKLTTELDMELEKASIVDKTCELVFRVNVEFSYSKDFTLNLVINI